ncbi:MAG: HEAT repeat domain-containing protein [Promethearchaeota archaeon]
MVKAQKSRNIKYIDELVADLKGLLDSGAPASKFKNSIDKLGNLGDKKAVPLLLQLIDHKTDYIRAAIIQALLKIRYERLSTLIMDLLPDEQSNLVKGVMIEALGSIEESKGALELLIKIRDDDSTPDKITISAIFAIDRITRGKISALKQLVDYLIDSRNPNIRVEAAKALGKLGDPRAKKYLIAALDDEKIFVRKFVIRALVTFGDRSIIDPILNAFTDENNFLDRDFIEVLYVFPEFNGKELWEIIEIRKSQKLDELKLPEVDINELEGNKDDGSSIKNAYQYEVGLPDGSCAEPPVDLQPPAGSSSTKDCPPETAYYNVTPRSNIHDNRIRAKKEVVPEFENEEIQMIKKELLDNFSDFFNKGEKFYRKKLYFEAITSFKKALEIKYDAWQAWFNMGLVFYDIDEKKKSMECFKKSLSYKHNEIDTIVNIASLYLEYGNYRESIKFFIRALKLSKYQSDVWLVLGKTFKKLRLPGFALYCFEQVLKMSKDKKERKEVVSINKVLFSKNPDIQSKNPLVEKMPEIPQEHLKLKL